MKLGRMKPGRMKPGRMKPGEMTPGTSTSGTRKARVTLAAILTVLATAAGVGVAGATDGSDPDTIVRVTGDAATGFGIQRLDGSAVFPPTDSEARAECGEYDRRWQRARCRTGVRVHYRDLAELQRSLRWARAQE